MNRARPASSNSNTIRYVLIGGLVLTLGFALYDSFFSSAGSDAASTFEQLADSVNEEAPDNVDSDLVTVPYYRLPDRQVDLALKHSPFEYDGSFIQSQRVPLEAPETEQPEIAIDESNEPSMMLPPQSSAEIILETSRGRVAKIGEHLIREGSMVGDGVYVQRIESDRIVLINEADKANENNQND